MAYLVPFRRNSLFNDDFWPFNSLLDDFFSDFPVRRDGSTFKMDVQENDNEYIVEAELPGVDKSNVSISLDDSQLTIAVKKEEAKEEENKNYLHKERSYCAMTRRVYLKDADSASEAVTAKMDNGILTITVPKKVTEEKNRRIEIQ